MKVSTLLLTFNEERNLPRCLASLIWCDDILVIDSGSVDDTVAIAEKAGARILRRPFDNFANQRNFGLDTGQLRHEWVLHLDADEVVTAEFRDKLEALDHPSDLDCYRIPSKIMLHDHWLRYAGMYPSYQVRLGHRERLRFKQVGHGQREDVPPNRVGVFSEPYLHYNFSHGLNQWLRKHLDYAEAEAQLLVAERAVGKSRKLNLISGNSTSRRRALKEFANRVPLLLRPLARMLYVLVWRRGFLDGRYGALYALMLSVYEGMIAILAADKLFRISSETSMPRSSSPRPNQTRDR